MKKILLSSLFMMLCIIAFSQSTFEIKKIGNQYSSEQISAVFNSADFCGSYFETKRNLITLNDGSEIELKSGRELVDSEVNIAPSCLLRDDSIYFISTWSISPEGYLMKGFDNTLYPTEKEYYHNNNINKQ